MTTKAQLSESRKEKKKPLGVKLELLSGPMDGLEFEITKEIVTVGREQNSDISVPLDIMISRSHAKITNKNRDYWLEDLGSRNGTFIGGEKVEGKVKLGLGTIFEVGVSEMRLTAQMAE